MFLWCVSSVALHLFALDREPGEEPAEEREALKRRSARKNHYIVF